jgi:hypothetical protein
MARWTTRSTFPSKISAQAEIDASRPGSLAQDSVPTMSQSIGLAGGIFISFIFALMLTSCGQESSAAYPQSFIDISERKIIWSGTASENPEYMQLWTRVENCLGMTAAMPEIVVVDGAFFCGGIEAYGCAVFGKSIYIGQEAYTFTNGGVLSHEFVHWITGNGSELHGSDIMHNCSVQINS